MVHVRNTRGTYIKIYNTTEFGLYGLYQMIILILNFTFVIAFLFIFFYTNWIRAISVYVYLCGSRKRGINICN